MSRRANPLLLPFKINGGGVKNIMDYYEEDILMHHGIKGQKWGVRRYQNPDGSLTSAGKRHYKRERFEKGRDVTLKAEAALSIKTDRSYTKRKIDEYSKKQVLTRKEQKKYGKLVKQYKELSTIEKKAVDDYYKSAKDLNNYVNNLKDKYKDLKIKDISHTISTVDHNTNERFMRVDDPTGTPLRTAASIAVGIGANAAIIGGQLAAAQTIVGNTLGYYGRIRVPVLAQPVLFGLVSAIDDERKVNKIVNVYKKDYRDAQ